MVGSNLAWRRDVTVKDWVWCSQMTWFILRKVLERLLEVGIKVILILYIRLGCPLPYHSWLDLKIYIYIVLANRHMQRNLIFYTHIHRRAEAHVQ